MFDATFIYLGEGLDPRVDTAVIQSGSMRMNVFGCENYEQAEELTKEMVAKGSTAVELCAGFGNEGIARIQKAAGPEVAVGAVKFDFHPALGFKSRDSLF